MSETITALGKERLEKLIGFIEKLNGRKFNFFEWVTKYDEKNHCGTVCCAFGWVPAVFPEDWKWATNNDIGQLQSEAYPVPPSYNPEFNDWGTEREDYFGISELTFSQTFDSNLNFGILDPHATRSQWLKNVRKVLAALEVIE